MAQIMSVENSIPVFTAFGVSSEKTASICLRTISARTGWMPVTPRGFCAVMQVMALVPWTPSTPKVFKSAWMPAPPPLSEPATVKAMGIFGSKSDFNGWPSARFFNTS